MDLVTALAANFDRTGAVFAGVSADQWDDKTPCAEWNVRALATHTLGVSTTWAVAPAARRSARARTTSSSDPSRRRASARSRRRPLAAWQDADLDAAIDFGAGPRPARVGLMINLLDTATHTWDLAVATGQPAELPVGVAEAALDAAQLVVVGDVRPRADSTQRSLPRRTPRPRNSWSRSSADGPSPAIVASRYRPAMRRSIDDALDDHPPDEEFPAISWMVGLTDDPNCVRRRRAARDRTRSRSGAGAGYGLVAHLKPATARRLRGAIAARCARSVRKPAPDSPRSEEQWRATRRGGRVARVVPELGPMGRHLVDADDRDAVLLGEQLEEREPRRRAVVVEDLADDLRPAADPPGGRGRPRPRCDRDARWTPPSRARSGKTWPGRMK